MLKNWKNHKGKLIFVGVAASLTGVMAMFNANNKLTTQAFINAPVVSIRAPIPGRTALVPKIVVGQQIQKGQELAVIEADTENPRISVLKGQISALESTRGSLASELEKLSIEIGHRKQEYADLEKQVKTQFVVDVEGGKASVTMAESDLASARLYQQEAKRNFNQASELRKDKYISKVSYEKLEDEYGRAQARTASAEERLKRAQIALDALQQGMQIDGPRALPYVVTRSKALDEAISDLGARKQHTAKQINLLDVQIAKLKEDLAQQTLARLESPVSGAVWDIISNNGDAVSQQSPVLKVVNCEASWVEAFLDEGVAATLRVGDTVKIQQYFGDEQWRGDVMSIRYGTGRVTVGQYVVDPPPEVMRRQLPVRVATVKIGVNWGRKNDNGSACNVGSSVKVYRS